MVNETKFLNLIDLYYQTEDSKLLPNTQYWFIMGSFQQNMQIMLVICVTEENYVVMLSTFAGNRRQEMLDVSDFADVPNYANVD